MLKTEKEWKLLDADFEDVLKENYLTEYEKRTASKENVYLADFVAFPSLRKNAMKIRQT